MNHSKNFNTVKNLYEQGLWSMTRIADAVYKKWITEEEYYEITGKEYAKQLKT